MTATDPPLFVTMKIPHGIPHLPDERLEAKLEHRLNGLCPKLAKRGRLQVEMGLIERKGMSMGVHMEQRHSSPEGGTCPNYADNVAWIESDSTSYSTRPS